MSQLKDVIAFIFASDLKGERVPIGTGFWIAQTKTNDLERSYFVTAKHVLWNGTNVDLKGKFLRLNKGGQAEFVGFNDRVQWLVHPDPTVDIVALKISPPSRDYKVKYFPLEMVLSEHELIAKGIEEGDDVFFAGLFTSFFGKTKNLPIFRFGKVAMLSDEKIPWVNGDTRLYLMETQSYPGNSGSPVLFNLASVRKGTLMLGGSQIFIAGVMTGYFGTDKHRPIIEAQKRIQYSADHTNLGIAGVTPGHFIREIILLDK